MPIKGAFQFAQTNTMRAKHKLLRNTAFNLLAVMLTSCSFGISDLWTVKCSDMPPEEEVIRVMQEFDY